jgi:N utilization substance protein B
MPPADPRASGGARNARRRAREFALQGLYQWQLTHAEPMDIVRNLREDDDYGQADPGFVEHLVLGPIADADELSDWMQPFLDRPMRALSPVERGILLLAGFELRTAPEAEYGAPYRVVINEAVELAKRFGGTDGHKYVNGVLDKLAGTVRSDERANAPRSKGNAGGGRRRVPRPAPVDAALVTTAGTGGSAADPIAVSIAVSIEDALVAAVHAGRAQGTDSE